MLRVIILASLIIAVTSSCYYVLFEDWDPPRMKPGEIRFTWAEMSHYGAHLQCEAYGGKLANIDTKEKWDDVYKCHYAAKDRTLELWTAAKEVNGHWQWENGKNVTGEWCKSGEGQLRLQVVFSTRNDKRGCFKTISTMSGRGGALCEYKRKKCGRK